MGRARHARSHVVRSGRDQRDHHAVHVPLRAPRRAREADAGQPDGAEPRGVLDRRSGRPQLRVRPAPRREVPQRRSAHRRGREVLPGAISRRRRRALQGAHGERRRARSPPHPLSLQAAVARLHDVLRHDGDRRRVDRPQEVPRARRGRRLQEGAGGRRALQVRLVHPRRGADAGGPRAVLAKDAVGEAARLQGDSRRVDAPGDAQARRGRYRLFDPRCARRRIAADPGAHPQAELSAGHFLARVPRAVDRPEVALERPAAPARRERGDRSAGHQQGRDPGLFAHHRQHDPAHVRVLLARARPGVRSQARAAASGRSGLPERPRRRGVLLRRLLRQSRRGGGQLPPGGRDPGAAPAPRARGVHPPEQPEEAQEHHPDRERRLRQRRHPARRVRGGGRHVHLRHLSRHRGAHRRAGGRAGRQAA